MKTIDTFETAGNMKENMFVSLDIGQWKGIFNRNEFHIPHIAVVGMEEIYHTSSACILPLIWKWIPHVWGPPLCKREETYTEYMVYFLVSKENENDLSWSLLCPILWILHANCLGASKGRRCLWKYILTNKRQHKLQEPF